MVSDIEDEKQQQKPRRLSGGLVGLVFGGALLIGFFFVLAYGLTERGPVTGRSGEALVGQRAPTFELPLIQGGTFNLEHELGQPIVLNFWASWCPPCRVELPMLEKISKTHDLTTLKVVGINIQDTSVQAQQMFESSGLTFPNAYDARGSSAVAYGVVGLPLTFFIDSNGIIIQRSVGALTERELATQVASLLASDSG